MLLSSFVRKNTALTFHLVQDLVCNSIVAPPTATFETLHTLCALLNTKLHLRQQMKAQEWVKLLYSFASLFILF
jgi:hypothetical protein